MAKWRQRTAASSRTLSLCLINERLAHHARHAVMASRIKITHLYGACAWRGKLRSAQNVLQTRSNSRIVITRRRHNIMDHRAWRKMKKKRAKSISGIKRHSKVTAWRRAAAFAPFARRAAVTSYMPVTTLTAAWHLLCTPHLFAWRHWREGGGAHRASRAYKSSRTRTPHCLFAEEGVAKRHGGRASAALQMASLKQHGGGCENARKKKKKKSQAPSK